MKNRLHVLLFVALAVLLLWGLSSCRKERKMRSEWLLPLVHSSLGPEDVFEDSLLAVNSDQSLSLIINQKLIDLNNRQLFDVNDTLSKDVFKIPIYFNLLPGQKVLEKPSTYEMHPENVELKEALASEALLKFVVVNTIKEKLQVKYEVLSSDKNGHNFEIYTDVPAADASGPIVYIDSINLADYHLDFTGENHDRYNIVRSKTTVWLHPDADTILITPSDSVYIISIFNHLSIKMAKGLFKTTNISLSDSLEVHAFDEIKSGRFDMQDIQASINIDNYVGADLQISLQHIHSINTSVGSNIPLSDPLIGSRLSINRALETGDSLNPVIPKHYHFPLTQSNIDLFINNSPDLLGYALDYRINPLGDVSGGNDFIYTDKTLEGSLHLEIPLHVRFDRLVLEREAYYRFDKAEDIRQASLVIKAQSLFPFDMMLQLYFVDEQGQIQDSLFKTNRLIKAGFDDGNGYIVAPALSTLTTNLDEVTLERLRRGQRLLIHTMVDNPGPGHWTLYANNRVDIKIIADLQYEN